MSVDEDIITVIDHRPIYGTEVDSFDRLYFAAQRAHYASVEYEELTGVPAKIVFIVNPLNIFPVHDVAKDMQYV